MLCFLYIILFSNHDNAWNSTQVGLILCWNVVPRCKFHKFVLCCSEIQHKSTVFNLRSYLGFDTPNQWENITYKYINILNVWGSMLNNALFSLVAEVKLLPISLNFIETYFYYYLYHGYPNPLPIFRKYKISIN